MGLVATATPELGTTTPALTTQAGGQSLMAGSQPTATDPANQTGLIATANGSAAPTAVPAPSVPTVANGGVSPGAAQTVITPDMTTSGQFQKLTAAGSPIIAQAQNQSDQNWNARGLLNSSMAAEAGQQAGYNAALPIAQADASANLAAASDNTKQQNALTSTAMGSATSLTNTGVTAANSQLIANTEANYKVNQTLQASVAQLQSNYTSQRSAIMQNTTMDAASKTAALTALDNQYKSDANMLGSVAGIDLTTVLNGV